LATLVAPGVASAQLEQRLRVWSCAHADSLLGPIGLDTAGFVLFTTAVRNSVLETRFNPARLNGRRVRQLLQQPFNFTLTP
jgi:hypothetical protein